MSTRTSRQRLRGAGGGASQRGRGPAQQRGARRERGRTTLLRSSTIVTISSGCCTCCIVASLVRGGIAARSSGRMAKTLRRGFATASACAWLQQQRGIKPCRCGAEGCARAAHCAGRHAQRRRWQQPRVAAQSRRSVPERPGSGAARRATRAAPSPPRTGAGGAAGAPRGRFARGVTARAVERGAQAAGASAAAQRPNLTSALA